MPYELLTLSVAISTSSTSMRSHPFNDKKIAKKRVRTTSLAVNTRIKTERSACEGFMKNTNSNHVAYYSLFLFAISGCGSDTDELSIAAQTAPAQNVGFQSTYQKEGAIDWLDNSDYAREKFLQNQRDYQEYGRVVNFQLEQVNRSSIGQYPAYNLLPDYSASATYSETVEVKYSAGDRYGVFTNKWWTKGELPSFESNSGPWTLLAATDAFGNYLTEEETVGSWSSEAVYLGADKTKFTIDGVEYLFEAKYWTKGDEPVLTKSFDPSSSIEDWETPWGLASALENGPENSGGDPDIIEPPVCETEADCSEGTTPDGTPTIPPVVIEPDPDPVVPPSPPIYPDLGPDGLPEEGYEFLKLVSLKDWDWLFPLRIGKYVVGGGTNNLPPFACDDVNAAQCNGKTDVYTLEAFINAVIEYNAWAASNGYKQFLNEGTISQQATEFTAFWAKSARETSGSWTNAPAPWIEQDNSALGIEGAVWKGALYWVEEVGYTTNDDGSSPYQSYIDANSSYTSVQGRSYHGRGIIQLSWNYNYGAYSEWLYNNGLMTELVSSKETLLINPGLVSKNGKLSMLAGIWFWMTPQGIKPSSHDVIMGNITNVSTNNTDLGLPQRNDLGTIVTASGESYDQAVVAYRLGTVINIVNGGLECNKAASWHEGPLQRVSYYNAYAQYFNNIQPAINIPLVEAATDVWTAKVSSTSEDNLKVATCYAQKSYYGW